MYGKFGIAALPGLNGTGSSSLGGANLAISAYSQHQRTALDFIKYMTNLSNERQMLEQGSFPPVWTQLYTDKSLISRYHYLPVLEQAINSARPRPAITNYDQASLAISSTVYGALIQQQKPQQAVGNGRAADPDYPRWLRPPGLTATGPASPDPLIKPAGRTEPRPGCATGRQVLPVARPPELLRRVTK